MDILGLIGENFGRIAISSVLATGGSWAALWISKQGIAWIRDFAVNSAIDGLNSFISDRDNRRVATEIVRWVEIKFPDHVGIEKKQAATRSLQAAIPGISAHDAGELVEYGVTQINLALKTLESKINDRVPIVQ